MTLVVDEGLDIIAVSTWGVNYANVQRTFHQSTSWVFGDALRVFGNTLRVFGDAIAKITQK